MDRSRHCSRGLQTFPIALRNAEEQEHRELGSPSHAIFVYHGSFNFRGHAPYLYLKCVSVIHQVLKVLQVRNFITRKPHQNQSARKQMVSPFKKTALEMNLRHLK